MWNFKDQSQQMNNMEQTRSSFVRQRSETRVPVDLRANAIALVRDRSTDALHQTLVLLVYGRIVDGVLSELALHL
jgi:hypothetical protein